MLSSEVLAKKELEVPKTMQAIAITLGYQQ